MIVLCCTRKLASRLTLTPGAPPTADVEFVLAAVPCLELELDAMFFRTAGALLGVAVKNSEWRVPH